MHKLLTEIKKCNICQPFLSHGANPVLSVHSKSKIAIIGQAPGKLVHETGIPWDDKSGDRLRAWLGVKHDVFYDEEMFALIPMGFCYPGKGKGGDLPPRAECAPKWHDMLFSELHEVKLILLVGIYAQKYYLDNQSMKTLTQTVKNYQQYFPKYLPLPHPSPRNNIWLKRNSWFTNMLVPELQKIIKGAIGT